MFLICFKTKKNKQTLYIQPICWGKKHEETFKNKMVQIENIVMALAV